MPLTTALRNAGTFRADEIAMLSKVFEELSLQPQFPAEEVAREALAAKIHHQYQMGTVDPSELKRICAKL